MKKAFILAAGILLGCLNLTKSMAQDAESASMMERILQYMKMNSNINPETDIWDAFWIGVPDASDTGYKVCYFRKEIALTTKPDTYKIRITADNRYKLYVNGLMVSMGPNRSDLRHWKYATIDLAPYLKTGQNVLAVQVWNAGDERPMANFSSRTALLVLGLDDAKQVSTNSTWKCILDPAYQHRPSMMNRYTYYCAGPGDCVDMNQTIADWKDADCDLSRWQNATSIALAYPHNTSFGTGGYDVLLEERDLPEMEFSTERIPTARRDGGLKLPKGWPAVPADVTIPANKSIDILIDQEHLTNAFFNLKFSQGKGSTIVTTYAESLYDTISETLQTKGNRNNVDGKQIIGRQDSIVSNGTTGQLFTTLEWRTYRYINLHIETHEQPLIINDLWGNFTGYPFQLKASLDTNDTELQKIFEIGWRTARLCAHETYMDCPYYEQLQYLGDTRIQALITLYNTGDETMVKNFLTQSEQSRNAEGCTQGRYPTSQSQYITPYALSYIYALHDYMRYGKDDDFLRDLMPGAEGILHYFSRYQQADGRIKNLPGWNFVDWVYNDDGWKQGVPERGKDGCSIVMDLQLLLALQMMCEMERHFGENDRARTYDECAQKLAESVQRAYWNESRGLYSDRIEQDHFSQHGNCLALICGLAQGEQARSIGQKLMNDATLAPASVYFKHYLHEGLVKAGLGDDYLSWLDIWRENIRMGLTTWAETSDIDGTRSDCHAWGASPNIELFRTILGIDSKAAHFSEVRIEPHLAGLKADKKGIRHIGGTMPHPQGEIHVDYTIGKDGKLKATISLPNKVTGTFVWKGQETLLHGGENVIL